jgi:DNA-binding LacI/PurR family transcriptional regulator
LITAAGVDAPVAKAGVAAPAVTAAASSVAAAMPLAAARRRPPDRPTAIIFDNDVMAVTALGVAAEFGLSVPGDLSLIAWDDSQLCQLTRPTLSAMQHDIFAFGADVAQTLFALMSGGENLSHAAQIPALIPRGSTSRPA